MQTFKKIFGLDTTLFIDQNLYDEIQKRQKMMGRGYPHLLQLKSSFDEFANDESGRSLLYLHYHPQSDQLIKKEEFDTIIQVKQTQEWQQCITFLAFFMIGRPICNFVSSKIFRQTKSSVINEFMKLLFPSIITYFIDQRVFKEINNAKISDIVKKYDLKQNDVIQKWHKELYFYKKYKYV